MTGVVELQLGIC